MGMTRNDQEYLNQRRVAFWTLGPHVSETCSSYTSTIQEITSITHMEKSLAFNLLYNCFIEPYTLTFGSKFGLLHLFAVRKKHIKGPYVIQ
jgi:hypothetical protein